MRKRFPPHAPLLAILVAAAAGVLLASIYRCPVRHLLGIECPGCGGTRAFAALLVGHWREAWQQNALVVTIGLAAPGCGCLYAWASSRRQSSMLRRFALPMLLGAMALFTVVRNWKLLFD